MSEVTNIETVKAEESSTLAGHLLALGKMDRDLSGGMAKRLDEGLRVVFLNRLERIRAQVDADPM